MRVLVGSEDELGRAVRHGAGFLRCGCSSHSRMMTFGRRSLSMALTAEEKRGSPWVSGASQVYFVFFLRKCACHMYIFYFLYSFLCLRCS